MPVIVKRRRSYCWSCGAVGHMAKACASQKSVSQPSQTAAAAVTEAVVVFGEFPDGECNDVSKKGQKTPNPLPQQVIPQQEVPQQAEEARSEQEEQHQPLPQPTTEQHQGKEARRQKKEKNPKSNWINNNRRNNKNRRIVNNQKIRNSVKKQIWEWMKCLHHGPPP